MNSKKLSPNRPLSPHIQIYKPQIGSLTSILHRLTGISLYVGVVIIFWAIVNYTYQVEIMIDGEVSSGVACSCFWTYALFVVAAAWSWALYYHLCNGIRHLFWDIGKGFDKKIANRNGIIVLLASTFLTIASIYYVLFIV
ncbi:MAG: succinate dehydrogenase / fumarate reductase cytochrome b subunit [Rickettsiales bacterium]|jgi:succinate dehydrogenase / fumarate reductase cytochrome b subunit